MKLAECMMNKRVTQTQLARDLGVSRQTINNWIYQRSIPSSKQMIAVYKWSNGRVNLKDWCEDFDAKA